MAKQDSAPQTKQDEFSRIFDEYRAKIEEITQRTETNLRNISAEADIATSSDSEKDEIVVSRASTETPQDSGAGEPDLKKSIIEVGQLNAKEAEEILAEARHKARQIIEEAEKAVKKEARKKTQSEVEKIISKARKDAEAIVAQANQAAERERDEVIAASKQEVERLVREITEKCRQESQEQASRTLAEAQQKAKIMLDGISASTVVINKVIGEMVGRAKQTISEFETGLQKDSEELTKVITVTQVKLAEVSRISEEAERPAAAPPAVQSKNREVPSSPTLAVRLMGERSNGNNGAATLFSGRVEMKSISPTFDYQYLKNMKKYLVSVPYIKDLQEYASEKEMSVLFEVKEPAPLLEIFRNIPLVTQVITEADGGMSLVFKNPA